MTASYSATGLTGGGTYKFKIEARNTVGYSLYSSEISVLCSRVPDAPVGLADKTSITSDVQIGITWLDGASNGGAFLTNYQVLYDLGTNNWVILASGVATRSYTATGLTPGATY